ncbi:ABC transporter permease [Rhizosaccharibacter radicis]|uniref:ABC transporter permease n=1 Tax=Rhizosaccharibacter radicis TaxID=2782605 RepID=A0ABT1VVM8_9PROT|nr:ABC transporter permease [Acetobacteraceae bacterium KSS12]
MSGSAPTSSAAGLLGRLRGADLPLLVAGGCILVILCAGATVNGAFLSPHYLIQQAQVASFLGIVATGAMLVILLGHIDLSVPWTLTAGAMLGTGLAGTAAGGAVAIPVALAVGALVGLVNGIGVAILRIPSMIFTLGVNAVLQGLMVLYTGGSAPPSTAAPLVRWLAGGHLVPGLPNAILVWAAVGLLCSLMLRRTIAGRTLYAVGNRERAAYLNGMPVRRAVCGVFVLAGMCSTGAGVLLTGYSGKAFQGMGDSYLLPAIAAVVLGGTSIMGGQGRYAGTVVGTILIVLLQSMLAVLQMPDAGRQIIYGLVIFCMLLLYGRQRAAR